MTEIDLIPHDYRIKLQLIHRIKIFSIILSFVVVLLLAATLVLRYQAVEAESAISLLQKQNLISTGKKNELKLLTEKKQVLSEQLQLLNGLHGGMTATKIFRTIDNAVINRDVWFLNWRYLRKGSVLKKDQKTTEVGYFIILPKDERTGDSDAWHIKMQMNIKGQAVDYDALSKFVSRLIKQPEIHDVRILNTMSRDNSKAKMIEFNLLVSVAGSA